MASNINCFSASCGSGSIMIFTLESVVPASVLPNPRTLHADPYFWEQLVPLAQENNNQVELCAHHRMDDMGSASSSSSLF